jgi:hypothetical protein
MGYSEPLMEHNIGPPVEAGTIDRKRCENRCDTLLEGHAQLIADCYANCLSMAPRLIPGALGTAAEQAGEALRR